jgi:hypothetical protein
VSSILTLPIPLFAKRRSSAFYGNRSYGGGETINLTPALARTHALAGNVEFLEPTTLPPDDIPRPAMHPTSIDPRMVGMIRDIDTR